MLALQLQLTKGVQNRSGSLTTGVDGCTGTGETKALVARTEVNVVPKSGNSTGEETTRFSREDSQKSWRRVFLTCQRKHWVLWNKSSI